VNNITNDSDKPMNVLGVSGRLTHRTIKPGQAAGLWFKQRWISASRPVAAYGKGAVMSVEIRFDDELGNRHNTFAITAEVRIQGRHDIIAGGCMHEEITKVFPELAPLIKWHLCSTDGPMHYIGNTVYFAGNRDHHGLLKGESRQIKNGRTGKLCWRLVGGAGWREQTFDGDESELPPIEPQRWIPWCRVGEGKERQLDVARSAAIWPEATDEQLTTEPEVLRAALEARLPALLADFASAMNTIGFFWSPEEFAASTSS
jgi:hypothetical protein